MTVTATPVQKATGNPWYHVAEHKKPIVDAFQHMRAEDVTVEWIDTDPRAFMQPFIIDEPEGLDMSVLPKDMRVSEIAEIVGPDRPLDVIGELYARFVHTTADVSCFYQTWHRNLA